MNLQVICLLTRRRQRSSGPQPPHVHVRCTTNKDQPPTSIASTNSPTTKQPPATTTLDTDQDLTKLTLPWRPRSDQPPLCFGNTAISLDHRGIDGIDPTEIQYYSRRG
jgi:hypothetical protein